MTGLEGHRPSQLRAAIVNQCLVLPNCYVARRRTTPGTGNDCRLIYGLTEALLLVRHGFTREMSARLVRDGLATATNERV